MINIVGNGFVGKSICHVLEKNNIEHNIFDVNLKYTKSLKELVNKSEEKEEIGTYFICVPTPSTSTGDCDISIVVKVLNELSLLINKKSNIVIKSTVKPGTTRKLAKSIDNTNISLFFSPEFLREASFKQDSYCASYVFIGKQDDTDSSNIEKTYRNMYCHNKRFQTITRTMEFCELYKYTVNTFLASKIQFFNEIFFTCEKIGVDYNDLLKDLKLEERIGESHTQVPGPDGSFSFGGKCLPKEIRGFSKLQEELNLDNSLFSCIIERNKVLRPNDPDIQG